jgi:RND family efflux transporter MFP subunit
MAQVLEVNVSPGESVEKDQVLVVLDSRQFESRLDQARKGLKSAVAGKKQAEQSVAAARAAFSQARADYQRIKTYYESQAATEQQLEAARSAYLQAEAGLRRAREGLSGSDAQIEQAREVVREAEISKDYTTLRAPEAGEVLKRMVEPGDLALPGKPLLILQTTGNLRLEAYVREGLIKSVQVGEKLPMEIRTLEERVEATVEEIIPYADPQTRTFLVKAAVPSRPGIYPGMFGKLLIPVREHPVVLIPETAVRKVGQLELVTVKVPDGWQSRFIKTGRTIDDKVVVLSGLSGDETIGVGEYR